MKPKNVTLFAHYTSAGIGRTANINRMIMAINEKNTEYKVFFLYFQHIYARFEVCYDFYRNAHVNYGFGNVEL